MKGKINLLPLYSKKGTVPSFCAKYGGLKLYLYSNLRWIGLLLGFWALVTSNKRPTRTRNDWIWPPYSLEAILKTRRSLTCQIQPAKEDERVTDLFRRILSQSASLFCKDRRALVESANLGKTSGKCHQRRENLNVLTRWRALQHSKNVFVLDLRQDVMPSFANMETFEYIHDLVVLHLHDNVYFFGKGK